VNNNKGAQPFRPPLPDCACETPFPRWNPAKRLDCRWKADFSGQILSAILTVPFVAICNQSGQTPSSAGNHIMARKLNLVSSPDHCPFKRAVQPVINVSGEEVPEGNELIRKRPSGATAY